MREDRKRQEKEARDRLKQDPTNLELAHRYWNAMGPVCGGAVFDAYRDVALVSSAGAAAFARAYRELYDCSGEPPYKQCFDELLIQALKAYRPKLKGEDRANVEWILKEIGMTPHQRPIYAHIWLRGLLRLAGIRWP